MSNALPTNAPTTWVDRAEEQNDLVTHDCLKTTAAFLNTEGATLLIGVGDSGEAIGIETDGFPNDDRFQLHLYSVIKASIGAKETPLIEADIDRYQGKRVCAVRCRPSDGSVYLKAKGRKDEEFLAPYASPG